MILARGSQLYSSASQSNVGPIRRFGRRLRFAVLCDAHPFSLIYPFFHEDTPPDKKLLQHCMCVCLCRT